jgi:hypothetical protein
MLDKCKILFLLISVFILGCSNHSQRISSPVTTDIDPLPTVSWQDNLLNHSLLGSWLVTFDPEEKTASVEQFRSAEMHFEISVWLPAPYIRVNSFDPVNQVIDVDVTLSNPHSIAGYDVRLIIYQDQVGHDLINQDGMTILYNLSGTQPINPFKAYGKDQAGRIFDAHKQLTENLLIKIPSGNLQVMFSIDASTPGNCQEPYAFVNYKQNGLRASQDSTARVRVDVLDWQNDVNGVAISCPEITGQALTPGICLGDNKWQMTVVNHKAAPVGDYTAYLMATSANSGVMLSYDRVILRVEHLAHTWGGAYSDTGMDVACDDDNNIYVSGAFAGSVDFNPGPGEDYHNASGVFDSFLSKFNRYGEFQWVKTWGGTSIVSASCLAIKNSNIYILGGFDESADFNPGSGSNIITSHGDFDIFLSQFDTDGNYIRTVAWGGGFVDSAKDVTVDGDGNVYAVGNFESTVDFDPGAGTKTKTSKGAFDAFLSKFNGNCIHQWINTWGGTDSDYGNGVVTWDSFYVYVVGKFNGIADFDPTNDDDNFTTNGGYDAYLSKFSASGTYYDVGTWGGIGADSAKAIAVDLNGNLYITGDFSQTVDFNPGPNVFQATSQGGADIYVTKITSDGIFSWVKTWGGVSSEESVSVATDSDNNVYTGGAFKSTVDFDPGSFEDERTSLGGNDIFVSGLDQGGEYLGVATWGSAVVNFYGDFLGGIASDNLGKVHATGFFEGTVDFDPSVSGVDNHTANGEVDVYLLSF